MEFFSTWYAEKEESMEKIMDAFLQWALTDPANKGAIFISHNGSCYDNL